MTRTHTPTFGAPVHALLEALAREAEAQSRSGARRRDDPARRRESREALKLRHAQAVYGALTKDQTKFVRADVLAYEAAALVPGLTPTRPAGLRARREVQRDKDGIEVDQGIFFAHILARPDTGARFCHAMLLPRVEALARLNEFTVRGAVDLGTASVMRQGKAATVLMHNPRYLNAEDEATLQQTEICVDLAILDPKSELCVLRGDVVDNPKYEGQRVFSTGINLTTSTTARFRTCGTSRARWAS